jgi:hypothetical protein
MALDADVFIAAPNARISILAVSNAHETVYVEAD